MYILWGPWNINNWLGTHPVWGRPLLTNIYNALVQCNLPLYRVWQKCVKETDFRFTRYSKNVLHQPLTIKCIVLLSILSTYLLYNLFTLNWFHNLQHCSDLIKRYFSYLKLEVPFGITGHIGQNRYIHNVNCFDRFYLGCKNHAQISSACSYISICICKTYPFLGLIFYERFFEFLIGIRFIL